VRIPTDFGALQVDQTGKGEPLLFVHGFPLSGEMWRDNAARFSPQYRCIIPDLRGHGRSDSTETVSMADYANDLRRVLDATNERRPVVFIGLSMGGIIAFEFYRRFRDRLRALVLVDTRFAAETPDGAVKRRTLIDAVDREGSRAAADAMIPNLFAAGVRPDIRSRWHEILSSTSPQGIVAAMGALIGRPDYSATLASIDVPTLIIVGQQDAITPPSIAEEMHRRIRGSHYEIIADAGHMPPVERPEAFESVLRRFLNALPQMRSEDGKSAS